jgi:hypothetical protein
MGLGLELLPQVRNWTNNEPKRDFPSLSLSLSFFSFFYFLFFFLFVELTITITTETNLTKSEA